VKEGQKYRQTDGTAMTSVKNENGGTYLRHVKGYTECHVICPYLHSYFVMFICKALAVCCFVCSVQAGVSQHRQSETEDALVSSNMSVRSAAAAAAAAADAAAAVYPHTSSSSSDTARSRHVASRSSPDTAALRNVIFITAAVLLAKQFAARQIGHGSRR